MSTEVGGIYRSELKVVDQYGAAVDPATKVLTVTLPDQTTAIPSITRAAMGDFYVDYTIGVEGLHKFAWSTTGPVTYKTDYENANVWRSIIGITEAKNFINDTDDTRDDTLRMMMATATELAEGIVGNCVQQVYTNERISGHQKAVLRMPHCPIPDENAIVSITSVWPNGPTWPSSALIVYPDSGTCEPINMMQFWLGPWKATYTAGRLVIPQRIQLAVKEIIYDLWSVMRPYGADSLEPGPEETARYEQMVAGYEIPPHAKAMLELEAQPGFA
jgi:hypothetical protein